MSPPEVEPGRQSGAHTPPGPGYSALAALITYPDEGSSGHCRAWLAAWSVDHAEAAERIRGWLSAVEQMEIWQCQELYTRTFDLNPCCSLDVGYYLFGEDYQRGAFMAQVRSALDDVGIPRDQELPDHLPNLLRWLEHVRGTEDHIEMVAECLLPVLRKMDEAFNAPPPAKQGATAPVAGQEPRRDNPYRGLLQGVAMVLERDLERLDERSKEGVGAL